MDKWTQIIVGLVLVIISVLLWGMNLYEFGTSALIFLKGGIIWTIILIGLALLLMGISSLKD